MFKFFNSRPWKQISNVLFYGFIIAMLVPQTRKPIQAKLIALTSFAPTIKSDGATYLQNDLWLELISEDGKLVNLSSFSGKMLVVNLWATWCPPCVGEMPSMNEMYQALSEEANFAFISNEPIEKTRLFKESKGFDFPVYQIKGELPAFMEKSNSIPQTWIWDRTGRLIVEHSGAKDWSGRKTINKLKDLNK
jgi:thiol-disulfide isomerase/thioredoxin